MPPPAELLELGAGGGQTAAACAALGYKVTAIERTPRLAAHARDLAARLSADIVVLQEDFHDCSLVGEFHAVTYWDGFGVGPDQDQERLLTRISFWLKPGVGVAIVDVYTPWYWANEKGRRTVLERATREYGFNPRGCRMLDTWWPNDAPSVRVTQSLRCYSPADLKLLARDSGLELVGLEPGPGRNRATREWMEVAPLEDAMSFTAKLIRSRQRTSRFDSSRASLLERPQAWT